jgi:hypothetical protein
MEHLEQHEDAPPANNRAVKLPPFWTANPRAWFTSAEGAFRLLNIADEESQFFNCLHALPEATVSLIWCKRTRFRRTPTQSSVATCWLPIS